jgi:hypothetical protein
LDGLFFQGDQLSQLRLQNTLSRPAVFYIPQERVSVYGVSENLEHHNADLVENIQFVRVVAVDEQFQVLTGLGNLDSFQLFDREVVSDVAVELDGSQLRKALLIAQVDVYALRDFELVSHYLNGLHLHGLGELQNQLQRENCETRRVVSQ